MGGTATWAPAASAALTAPSVRQARGAGVAKSCDCLAEDHAVRARQRVARLVDLGGHDLFRWEGREKWATPDQEGAVFKPGLQTTEGASSP